LDQVAAERRAGDDGAGAHKSAGVGIGEKRAALNEMSGDDVLNLRLDDALDRNLVNDVLDGRLDDGGPLNDLRGELDWLLDDVGRNRLRNSGEGLGVNNHGGLGVNNHVGLRERNRHWLNWAGSTSGGSSEEVEEVRSVDGGPPQAFVSTGR
jgi:hypothetical protein